MVTELQINRDKIGKSLEFLQKITASEKTVSGGPLWRSGGS